VVGGTRHGQGKAVGTGRVVQHCAAGVRGALQHGVESRCAGGAGSARGEMRA
jgi:hypothetical protein